MAETVTMPKLGFDMQEGTLVRWVRHEGETVEKGQVLAEIETDKATVEVETSFSGVIARQLVTQGSIVPVGTPIAVIAQPGETLDEATPAQPAADPAANPSAGAATATEPVAIAVESAPSVSDGGRVKASPLARKMAETAGLELSGMRGSGPAGRIVKRDVEAALAAPVPSAPKPAPAVLPIAPAVTGPAPVMAEDVTIPMDRLRAAIGRRMVESKTTLPHFYVTHEYNVEPMLALRGELNALLPDDQKLTVNDFIIKATALALAQFPNLNASVNGNAIVRHGRVNVGVAVAVEGGLLTVVCKDADRKPVRAISEEIREMVARARAGRVRPDDIEGSTFSISNLGMFDVEHFIAIINPPEAAILAIGSAMKVPVVVDGEVRVGTRMKATLSADHRVTDGAEAAQFMQALALHLENPLRLLL